MTVSSSTSKVSYSGNGSLTAFAYTFKIFDQDDLTVILRASDGTETVQTITTHYTVSGVGDAGGGNVTFVTAPSATQTVVILREQPLTQELDLVPNNPFPAESLEESLDKLVFMVQAHSEELDRAIKASKTNTISSSEFTISAADRANKVFSFDASGDLAVTQELGIWKGDWATSTTYVVRDIIKDASNNNVYICVTAHTSSGSTPISSNADSAKWALLVDAASATSSASAAAASETAAQTAQTAAEAAQTAAETAQTAAETAQTGAETAETNAETAQAAAEAAQAAAELAYDNFDDRYLGAKASDPTLDNDGAALIDGALYFDTTNNVMKVYDLGGTAWRRTTPTTSDQTNINTVSGIAANVTTVAGISGNVTTVAGISADVTTVAADGTDIGIVAGISSNVTTVAGISANVTTVAGVSSGVTTVAGISADVSTVSGISSNVTTVANNSANVTTVAGISSDVTTVAGISSNVTTVATNLTSINSFANTYRIGTTDPTTSLDTGDLFFNTSSGVLKVYNGTAWEAGVTAGSGFLPLTGGTLTGGLTGTAATFTGDLTIDTNTLYVDSTNNRVGIGTTSIGANQTLQVRVAADQNIAFNAATGNPRITAFNDAVSSSLDLNFNGASLRFETGGTERMRINSSGNVGIGTTSPSSSLHVSGGTDNLVAQFVSSDTQSYISFSDSNTTSSTSVALGASANNFLVYTGSSFGTERMRIDASGNLLVGGTSAGGSSTFTAYADGQIHAYRGTATGRAATFTATTSEVGYFDRLSTDGPIVQFAKDGTTVGSIGTYSGKISIGSSNVNLWFYDPTGFEAVLPRKANNGVSDGFANLGNSSNRFKDLYLSGGVVETTTTVSYAASIALTYDNGSIQTVTLTGNVSFTDSLADGESVVLMLNAGASYTVIWPTMTWTSSSGNVAPTLTANDTLVFWKIGTTLYGAYAGSYT